RRLERVERVVVGHRDQRGDGATAVGHLDTLAPTDSPHGGRRVLLQLTHSHALHVRQCSTYDGCGSSEAGVADITVAMHIPGPVTIDDLRADECSTAPTPGSAGAAVTSPTKPTCGTSAGAGRASARASRRSCGPGRTASTCSRGGRSGRARR